MSMIVRSAALAAMLWAAPAQAHFLELIPSADTVAADTVAGGGAVTLDLTFTHPMERGPVMDMAPPARAGVLVNGRPVALTPTPRPVDGKRGWRLGHSVTEPGGHVFFAEQAPYWEPDEGKFIVHYAKVAVDVASGTGWDALVGFPVEIRPLARPYGLWTGNLFRGVALKDGQPLPFAEVEVEWRNDGSVTPPGDAFVTQVILADASGTFAYALPRAGWWGFTVLVDGAAPMTAPTGQPAPVELGGAMWVRAVDMN